MEDKGRLVGEAEFESAIFTCLVLCLFIWIDYLTRLRLVVAALLLLPSSALTSTFVGRLITPSQAPTLIFTHSTEYEMQWRYLSPVDTQRAQLPRPANAAVGWSV